MAFEGSTEITFMESVQSRRVIYLSCFSQSRSTIPVTLAQNLQPVLYVGGGLNLSTSSTLRAADATNGLYFLVLTQSECSAVGLAGAATLRCSNTSVQETRVNINFTKLDSADSMRFGGFALPNAAAGGLPTFGTGTGQLNLSGGSVGLVPGVMSGVSVEVATGGIQTASVGKGSYSGVSVEVKTGGIQAASFGVGNYSGVSVEIKTGGIQVASIGKGNYSGVSQEVLTGGIQTTSIGAGNYSGVSVEIKSGGIQAGSLGAATISSAKFAASAIDAVAFATDASQEIADTLLGRNIAGGSSTGRTVSEALYPLRNKSAIDGSTLTVYQVDDSTSAWTATISTGANPISGMDPAGP